MYSSAGQTDLAVQGGWRRRREFNPRWSFRDSRQFSGLVTFATRPLLRSRSLERRRGIEPRTPSLQLGRSPLAVAAHGTLGVIRTPSGGFGIRWPHHRHEGMWCARLDSNQHFAAFETAASAFWGYGRIGVNGRLSRIRTDTVHGLSVLPLPVGLRACGVRGEIRTRNNAALNRTRLPELRHPNMVGSQGFEPWMFPLRVTGATTRRFLPSQPTAQTHGLSKIWRKAGDSNAYVPRDPGLADQWDTNYPSLPGSY